MKQRKGKIQSINFEDDVYAILTKEIERTGNNYSRLINKLVHCTLGISEHVRNDMAAYAYQKALETDSAADEETGYSKDALLAQNRQYMDMVNLFTLNKGIPSTANSKMRRIDMKGAYLLCPDDWILLDICDPASSTNAVVIEFRNKEKLNLPHFVFFVDRPLDEEMKADALRQAAEASEEYRMLDAMDVKEQPAPGFYYIPDLGSTNHYPFGAMIVRGN